MDRLKSTRIRSPACYFISQQLLSTVGSKVQQVRSRGSRPTDLFRTGDKDPSKHANSAYLDLGPLYGHNQAQQDAVRTFKDGTLKPDTFSEPRILGQPPGVGALLVCFNRFHNYVVGQLAAIDEYGKFSLPTWVTPEHEGYEAAQRKRDNDLFQTRRLVPCGLYVNIILGDYVTTILNLNRSNTTWRLDPRKNFNDIFDVHGTPQGIGNQVSVEFNLIYRWHSATSSKDEKWAQEFFGKLFPGKKPTTISLADFRQGLQKWAHSISKDPGKWTFNGFKRTANGSYADADILKCLVEGTEDIAGLFKRARTLPLAFTNVGSRCFRGSKRTYCLEIG